MNFLLSWLEQIKNSAANLFLQPDWRTVLDIAIIAVLIYNVLRMLAQTRANSVIRGAVFVVVLTWLSDVLQFNTLNWLLQQLISVGTLLLVIVFQPELRRALEQIGRRRLNIGQILHTGTPYKTKEQNIAEIVTACVRLSKRKVGALIVMERSTGLQDIIESGTMIDAEITAPLLENIFEPNTPLHDGAVVMRGGRVTAAACLLQLSQESNISKDLGTRHRAALGISETTDCIAVIVSEETGIISVARDGKMTRYLDENSLTKLLSSVFVEEKTESPLLSLLKKKGAETK